jgi:hypothetical protein
MKLHTMAALTAAFHTRYPNAAQPGTIDSMAAASEVGTLEAAGIRSFDHFFQQGTLVPQGDFVEVTEANAAELIRMGRAVLATDAEVANANKVVA